MSNNETAVKQVKENENNQNNNNQTNNQTEQTFGKIREKVGETVNTLQEKTQVVKESVSGNLLNVADKVHQRSDTTQEFLDKKTDELNALAHRTIEKANDLAHKAGDVLNSSSEFIKNFDIEETRKQVKTTVQENPGTSLVVAGVFGLLIGLLIGRNNKSR